MGKVEDFAQAALAEGYSEEEIAKVLKAKGHDWSPEAPTRSLMSDALGAVGTVGMGALKGLDYAGGALRNIPSLGKAVTQVAMPESFEDVTNLPENIGKNISPELAKAYKFQGSFPTSADVMNDVGVPEGASVDLNPWMEGETSVRDVGGFAGDVLTDPLTYLSGGVSALAKGGKAARALNTGIKYAANPLSIATPAGKKLYSAAFKNVDTKLAEKGIAPISEDLFKNRFKGGYEELKDFSQKRMKELGMDRAELYSMADKLGITIDPLKAQQASRNYVEKIKGLDATSDLAPGMEAYLNKFVKPDTEAAAQAAAKYSQDMSKYTPEAQKYLQDISNYRKQMRAYKAQGGNELQDILPGFTDIGERSGTQMVDVPLRGADASIARAPEVFDEAMQYSLEPIKQKNVSIKGGLRSTKKDNLGLLSKTIAEQEPKYGMEQLAIEGLDLAPNSSVQMALPGMEQAGSGFQTSMMLAPPTKPIRPVKPQMADVPNKQWSLSRASDEKTALYDALPDSAFVPGGGGAVKTPNKELMKNLASDYRQAIIEAGNKYGDLGTKIDEVNIPWGSYIEAQKPIAKEIGKAERKNLMTQVKGALGIVNPSAAGGMYLMEGVNSPYFRTNAGLALDKLGANSQWLSPIMKDILLRKNNTQNEGQ